MFVYVLDKDGQPLMPTKRFGKVRRLLRDKKQKYLNVVHLQSGYCTNLKLKSYKILHLE